MGKERWRWGAGRSRDGDIIAKIATDSFNSFQWHLSTMLPDRRLRLFRTAELTIMSFHADASMAARAHTHSHTVLKLMQTFPGK